MCQPLTACDGAGVDAPPDVGGHLLRPVAAVHDLRDHLAAEDAAVRVHLVDRELDDRLAGGGEQARRTPQRDDHRDAPLVVRHQAPGGGGTAGPARALMVTPSGNFSTARDDAAEVDRMAQEDDSLTVALVHALDEVTRRVEEITTGEGLSLDQWLVLHRVAAAGDQAMRDLVAGTRLNDSTLTRVVDRLAALGLVFREADPTDRRRVRVADQRPRADGARAPRPGRRGRRASPALRPRLPVTDRLADPPGAPARRGLITRPLQASSTRAGRCPAQRTATGTARA